MNQGSAEYPPTGVTPTGQLGLSMAAPAFVPGQGPVGMGNMFYNSMPCIGNHMQRVGSEPRSADMTEPVNVYGSFQQ